MYSRISSSNASLLRQSCKDGSTRSQDQTIEKAWVGFPFSSLTSDFVGLGTDSSVRSRYIWFLKAHIFCYPPTIPPGLDSSSWPGLCFLQLLLKLRHPELRVAVISSTRVSYHHQLVAFIARQSLSILPYTLRGGSVCNKRIKTG